MDRNYCFRHRRHSYAACDAALAASNFINLQLIINNEIFACKIFLQTKRKRFGVLELKQDFKENK